MAGADGHSAFEEMMTTVESPVYLVTTVAGDRRSGCLVGFAAQMSIDPSRFVLGISRANHTHAVAAEADHLAVHVVGRDHLDLVRLFGSETGDEIDKFDRCSWTEGPFGLPVLTDAGIWFAGRVLDRIDVGGDHTCYVLEPVGGAIPGHSAVRGDWVGAADVDQLDPGHQA
ncbi:flavin reductase family protein [Gordonia neofelifaecis]|uniref:Flavin reductase domain-containing protein n=1 Tax=Gordonia neofelifaecis NRRL B-59395 TaxID=644548 RepID=F1YM29_9ACTN|nr:flavin reductase family protein [Gordonia neofelifaecis]EGD54280.1 flavin reductase domain-containing protein [Gordonia neofelifaecis NRRL B-59395]